ncbi:MAG TPA: ACT domain-containing protein [Thermodesulfovibrio thiophilus]|uniref:ACT domain-containing protein n=1 Tax=Thermodesulfovibrio thiophilus TaxID=340095 RepID=UPI00040E90C2|nr:ACT domain-containing protein [Thermodesulfovibrio thiophilus]HHW20028.1 ACT domain-containing protein [Thermodesulfovibrio thiophilus]HOA83306.1 ACT domain-containing protein [Thermodesulfovibrio thiophilus]HQA03688.1 ACT domain-containing protein [Thermodesulfovibrio thiophilus]HQD36491.1 ACT domain-containing protein [Thermodesulfovibrio thiophilus]
MNKLHIISVFAENKPGRLEKITNVLAEANINILAFSITSTNGFGVIKFMVDRCKEAYQLLKERGFTVSLNEAIGIEMKDQPGGLHEVVKVLSSKGINIESAAVYIAETRKKAYLIVEVENTEKAIESLKGENLRFLTSIQ